MTTVLSPQPWTKAWSQAVRVPAQEFALTPVEVLEGHIPEDLVGSFYQNGPGRLERGGQRAGHWFDGDGAILAVHFEAGCAQACYRYVKTAGFVAEEQAGRYLFSNYGMVAPKPWPWRIGAGFKNAANTAVLPLGDRSGSSRQNRLLALWEGGPPHALDLWSLNTLGIDDLSGSLGKTEPYSAHPKVDPTTGEIFNFSVQPGPVTWLKLYRSRADGKIQQRKRFRLKGFPLIHDMVLAGPYVVICIPPVRMQLAPALLTLKSFSECLIWRPELGCEILIFDRHSLNLVSRNRVEPWFQWHYANGYENPEGHLVIDLVRHPNFEHHASLRSLAWGYIESSLAAPLWRLRIEPRSAQLLSQEMIWDQCCEFPAIAPSQVGQRADAIYTIAPRPQENAGKNHTAQDPPGGELLGAIAKINPETRAVDILDCGNKCYPSGPIYAPREQTVGTVSNPTLVQERGWILSLVFNGPAQQTELWIIDGEQFGRVQCKLSLPQMIPPGFHGSWHPRCKSCP